MMPTHEVPLSATLSQLLVAFTLEVDDLFEVALDEAGFPEIGLSLIGWTNFLQYGDGTTVAIRDVMERSFASLNHVAQLAGVYERWSIVETTPAGAPPPVFRLNRKTPKRPAHATSKGITATFVAHYTDIGKTAAAVWPQILDEVEARWRARFGPSLQRARKALRTFVNESNVDLPQGVYSGWVKGDWHLFPQRSSADVAGESLPVLLSQALLRCTIDYESTAQSSMAFDATTLRVLTPDGVTVKELPIRSGVAPQMSSVQVNGGIKSGLAVFGKDPATRLKSVKLTADGARAQAKYHQVVRGAEQRLGPVATVLREAAASVLTSTNGGHLRVVEGLRPSEGTSRSGAVRPPLGIRPPWERPPGSKPYVGGAQDNRLKELTEQTTALVAEPLTYLPHYPVWDQNRGFGP